MKTKNMLSRIACSLFAIASLLIANSLHANAQTLSHDETNAAYSWSDSTRGISQSGTLRRSEPQWVLTDEKDVSVANGGTIHLKSYVMMLLNDTKLCKAESTHSRKFRGYVRARFETLFGTVIVGSDSGRVYSDYGTTAETPSSLPAVGWNGIAHTYCGTQ